MQDIIYQSISLIFATNKEPQVHTGSVGNCLGFGEGFVTAYITSSVAGPPNIHTPIEIGWRLGTVEDMETFSACLRQVLTELEVLTVEKRRLQEIFQKAVAEATGERQKNDTGTIS